MALDPIVLALVQNRLDDISRHMGWVMTRTARSPIFSQAHDFSCFITDPAGTLVSVADGIPIHTGGGGFTVRAVLAAFAGHIDDGDVFLSNDPYEAGGNHLPDWVITRPVFIAGQLVAFACNRAHQSDIGGGAAGAYNSAASEIFHEGLRLPVLKLVESDATREDGVAAPCCSTPVRRSFWTATCGRCWAQPESAPGASSNSSTSLVSARGTPISTASSIMPSGASGQPLPIFPTVATRPRSRLTTIASRRSNSRCALPSEGGGRGSDGGLHRFEPADARLQEQLARHNTYSAVYMALLAYFDPGLPRNEGAFRGVAIIAPEGSLVNAKAPAPMTMNTIFVAHEIIHAAWKALAQADPAHSCAGWGKGIFGITSGGIGSDNPFVLYHWNCAGGGGGVNGRDGFNQTGHIITLGGLTMHNIESYEQLYPARFLRQEYRCDTAGPGEYRGGTGVHYEVDIEVPAEHSFRGEGLVHAYGFGVNGGGTGSKGEMTLYPVDGEPFAAPQYGVRRLGPLRLTAASPAGGGWGDPFERDPARVLRDVRDEVISREAAAEVLRRHGQRGWPQRRRRSDRGKSARALGWQTGVTPAPAAHAALGRSCPEGIA